MLILVTFSSLRSSGRDALEISEYSVRSQQGSGLLLRLTLLHILFLRMLLIGLGQQGTKVPF